MSKRAVIYARVSTDMHRDNFSIPSQISECLKHVNARRYSLIGNQYVDAETGKDVLADTPDAIPAYVDDYTSRELSRPSLDAALYFLEIYGFDVLVVHALDRLARDPYIRKTLEREFNKRGPAWITFWVHMRRLQKERFARTWRQPLPSGKTRSVWKGVCEESEEKLKVENG